jgi:glycosyltransferase involved in cell wall biosynthesis
MPSAEVPSVRTTALPCPERPHLAGAAWYTALAAWLARHPLRRYDAVLLRETPYGIAPALAARSCGRPLILEVNGIPPTFGFAGAQQPFLRAGYRLATRIVTTTETLARYLKERFHVPPAKTCVIPNAADTTRFRPIPRNEARKRCAIAHDRFVVLYMGAYDPEQGVPILTDICARLRTEVPQTLFLMLGSGPDRRRLEADVRRRGLEDYFRFVEHPPENDLAFFVSCADVAISPIAPSAARRRSALMPQKVVDTLSCGVPVLAITLAPAVQELLVEHHCGWVVPPEGDVASRASGVLRWAATHPHETREAGARGAAYVRAHLSYEQVAERFERLIESLVAAKRP